MKKSLYGFAMIAVMLGMIACSSKKESAASIAQEWCDLNGKAYKAAEGPEKEAAVAARKKFEDNMSEKYKDDKAFMDEIGKEVEKCEDASEGR